MLLECCGAEGAVLFLPDGAAGYTKTVRRNLSDESDRRFIDYYRRFDPLSLLDAEYHAGGPLALAVDYDSYRSGEYYCDFLKPNGIARKLLVYLPAAEGLQGKAILTRPEGSVPFSPREATIAGELSPYLAYALVFNALRNGSSRTTGFDHKRVSRCYGLTVREAEVARSVFDGLHNAEIAERLFVCESTVKKHLQAVYSKVGVDSRAALINRIVAGAD